MVNQIGITLFGRGALQGAVEGESNGMSPVDMPFGHHIASEIVAVLLEVIFDSHCALEDIVLRLNGIAS